LSTATAAPGTDLAVIPRVTHHIQLRGLPRRRIAVCCSCQPGTPNGVQDLASWDGRKVLDVQAEHEAAAAAREKGGAHYTRSVLPLPPPVAKAAVTPKAKAGGQPL
jgi:hypothetical protein